MDVFLHDSSVRGWTCWCVRCLIFHPFDELPTCCNLYGLKWPVMSVLLNFLRTWSDHTDSHSAAYRLAAVDIIDLGSQRPFHSLIVSS
jgi:hypothetical protein